MLIPSVKLFGWAKTTRPPNPTMFREMSSEWRTAVQRRKVVDDQPKLKRKIPKNLLFFRTKS